MAKNDILNPVSAPVAAFPVPGDGVPIGVATPSKLDSNGDPRKEKVSTARFEPPSLLAVTFQDGFCAKIPIESFGMPLDRVLWDSLEVQPPGDSVSLIAVKGEIIPLDGATLRYLSDSTYAAELDSALDQLKFTDDELERMARENVAPAALSAAPIPDISLESWK